MVSNEPLSDSSPFFPDSRFDDSDPVSISSSYKISYDDEVSRDFQSKKSSYKMISLRFGRYFLILIYGKYMNR